ncbi:DUF84 family protein [Candidatus Saccharibacteria bacterium]|nr:DUF84 family protein [Candidatus Saccharibacteria bacterium]
MKILVGSQSTLKIETVRKVVAALSSDAEIFGLAAESNVPTTPWDDQTHDGARNRAKFCRQTDATADLCVGLESGLVIRYGNAYEEAWACAIDTKGREYLGYSSGLRLPQSVVEAMNQTGRDHGEVMRILRQDRGRPGDAKDTWGDYTGGQLMRDVSLEEALRNALIQATAPMHSMYHDEPATT